MTAVAASTYRAPRQSFRLTIRDAYIAASIFALEHWCDAGVELERQSQNVRVHGPSAAYARAEALMRGWQDEADRCEAAAKAIEAMA